MCVHTCISVSACMNVCARVWCALSASACMDMCVVYVHVDVCVCVL